MINAQLLNMGSLFSFKCVSHQITSLPVYFYADGFRLTFFCAVRSDSDSYSNPNWSKATADLSHRLLKTKLIRRMSGNHRRCDEKTNERWHPRDMGKKLYWYWIRSRAFLCGTNKSRTSAPTKKLLIHLSILVKTTSLHLDYSLARVLCFMVRKRRLKREFSYSSCLSSVLMSRLIHLDHIQSRLNHTWLVTNQR